MHVAIIGAYGSAGVAVAERLADRDAVDRLTLADDGDPGGGLCILRGCMPSKELLSAAAHRYRVRHDARLDGDPPELNLDRVVATKEAHVQGLAAGRRERVHELADRSDVDFRHETARFVDDDVVAVGGEELEAEYVVVATGSTVNRPDLPGLNETPYYTSADVLDATTLPDSGVVVGFGYVGLELVPYLAEAGVDLTVVEHGERPLDEGDPAYGDELLATYREEFGVEILTETRERRVESTAEGVRLHVDRKGRQESVDAEGLFLFAGRRPNLDGLGLESTSLTPDDDWVAATMQARDHERVFVVGDANGREPILHVAKEQGHRAAENVLAHARDDPLEPYENVHHHVIFAAAGVYPYARVGHSAASAADAGVDHVTVTQEASDTGVFKVKDAPRGLATLVVGDDGTVLGYQGFHLHADVMAKTMQVAVEMALNVRELPDRAYHPTTPELLDGLVSDASDELAR